MVDLKIIPGVRTLSEDGLSITKHVKEVLRECGVETNCPCPEDDCGPSITVNDAIRDTIQLLAQRILQLEADVAALQNP